MLENRKIYRQRLDFLISTPPLNTSLVLSDYIEAESNWAKFVCVLVSGYLEQSFKDICLNYVSTQFEESTVFRYVEETWPESANMTVSRILDIIRKFNPKWADFMEEWIQKENLKPQINNVISWRNAISHGEENSTTGVTLNSMQKKYAAVNLLLDKIEELFQVS